MPDNVDFIQEQQAELLERQINAARVKHCGASALVCEECDAPIPAARRAAYPSATRCVSCQSVFEAKQTLPENGMSIRIEIGERYVVTSDSFQFILHEKKRAESGKNAGQEWLAVVGYYPKLSQLVSGLMHHDILTGSAKSFADLNAQVEQLSRRCSEAFGSYGR